MSDVYYVQCPKCEEEALELADSPACLSTVSKGRSAIKHRSLLIVESEIEFGNGKKKTITRSGSCGSDRKSPKKEKVVLSPNLNKKNVNNNRNKKQQDAEEYEIADDAVSLNGDLSDDIVKIGVMNEFDANHMIRVNGKEEFPVEETMGSKTKAIAQQKASAKRNQEVSSGQSRDKEGMTKVTKTPTASSTNSTSSRNRFSLIYRKSSNKLSLKKQVSIYG